MHINKITEKLGNGITVMLLFAVFIFMCLLINGKIFSSGQKKDIPPDAGILDMEINYDADRAYQLLTGLGDDGRRSYYKTLISLDLIYPVTYSLFMISLILFLLRKINLSVKKLSFFPVISFISDYAENFLVLNILDKFPDRHPVMATAANIFTLSKFIFILVSSLIISGLAVLFLYKRYKKIL